MRPTRDLALGVVERLEFPDGLLLPEPVAMPAGARYARVRADVSSGSWFPAKGGFFQCGDPFVGGVAVPESGWEAWGPVRPSVGSYFLDTPHVPASALTAAGAFEMEVVDWEPIADACTPGVELPLGGGVLWIQVDAAEHALDIPLLDVDGVALGDSAGQVTVASALRVGAATGTYEAGIWLCPGACTETAAAAAAGTCLAVPGDASADDGVCVAPGLYALVATWYNPSFIDLADPDYYNWGQRSLLLDVVADEACAQ